MQESSLVQSLSPLERKVLPHLLGSIEHIKKETGLDDTSVLRALKFLENKKLLTIEVTKKKMVHLGTNGIYYKKNHLPERKLLIYLEENPQITLSEVSNSVKLSENEFKVSIGVLKQKALITLENGKISLTANKEELKKKFLEEQLIDQLPLEYSSLSPEQKFAFESLKKRKEMIELKEEQEISFSLTALGKSFAGTEVTSDLIEEITPEIIKNWTKSKKIRKYDLQTKPPRIHGGKVHFVNQAAGYAKRIWTDMGFKEMEGTLLQTSFWNFDALFTPQDHPVRELQDTFFIKDHTGSLPQSKIVEQVKKAHESGIAQSVGWKYAWNESTAKKIVLRTHTTALSAKQLSILGSQKEKQGKFFALGKCFRNETVDWSHGFEFNQTEGIVVDPQANFRQLFGYLIEFYKKMGFEKVRFVPSYFPYTEPSVEIYIWHTQRNKWFEIGGAGILRPEVVLPLLGEDIPVLAWGPGFDRIIMEYYEIKDLREMYENDIKQSREKKVWMR